MTATLPSKDVPDTSLVAYLKEALPQDAQSAIPQIVERVNSLVDGAVENALAEYTGVVGSVGDNVEVDGLPNRAVVERVEAYGLGIELDAAGLAVSLHSDRGFLA
jgi:hypothetical protein